jgi:hypothetical protein
MTCKDIKTVKTNKDKSWANNDKVNELDHSAKTEAKRGGTGATLRALGLRLYPRMRVAGLFMRRVAAGMRT